DDTAAMYEVISRRFKRYLADRSRSGEVELDLEADDVADASDAAGRRAERAAEAAGYVPRSGEVDADAPTDRRARFAYPPNLVVVDGGPPRVAAAARAPAGRGSRRAARCGPA